MLLILFVVVVIVVGGCCGLVLAAWSTTIGSLRGRLHCMAMTVVLTLRLPPVVDAVAVVVVLAAVVGCPKKKLGKLALPLSDSPQT